MGVEHERSIRNRWKREKAKENSVKFFSSNGFEEGTNAIS